MPLNIYDTETDRPPLVLANGLGGPFAAWQRQLEFLSGSYRVISWDYRGLFDEIPRGFAARPTIATHATDLAHVLESLAIAAAPFIGWSMGAQVVLELCATFPQRVSKLVLINPSGTNAFRDLRLPGSQLLLPLLLRAARRTPRLFGALLQTGSQYPGALSWFQRAGVLSRHIEKDLFREVSRAFARVHTGNYLEMLSMLGEHDPNFPLSDVRVPVLVIAGGRDPLTPPAIAERMAQQLPHSTFMLIPEASHYAPLEFPELVNSRVFDFLRTDFAVEGSP